MGNESRHRQVLELASFINRHAPSGDPVGGAGDYNLGIKFKSFGAEPTQSQFAVVLRIMKEQCHLTEATSAIRSGTKGISEEDTAHDATFSFQRPTCGYTGFGCGGP